MNNCLKLFAKTFVVAFSLCLVLPSYAGNPDRAGSAGGMQLLVNPWVRSNGLAGANMADATPVESIFQNVAGLAFVEQTEIGFTYSDYLSGSDVSVNSVALAQRVGETSALGLSVASFGFGDIRRTTTETPDGDGTFFNLSVVNIGLSYAKAFSNSIYGGITLKVISESTADLNSNGVAFDAGIKYVTGDRDQIKFGITLKNVGPSMSFEGDGLSFQGTAPDASYAFTSELRSENYELPSLVSIGASYDFILAENHNLTAHGTFIANSFTRDNFLIGASYNFKEMFYVRGGYHYEEGITNDTDRRYVYTGIAVGAGLQLQFGEKNSRVSLDYAWRASNPFNGTHCIGARIHIGKSQ